MVDSNKKTISEEDVATLLQRYDVNTILRLLQEMAYYSEVKMDWDELVKRSTTGITNAREYQLLWRHLSYREPLVPVEDDDAQPMDDDSDMECELEASPAVSSEASVEAIAHVKVMAASYVPSDSDILDDTTVEAPMTINIPYSLPEGTPEPSKSPWSTRGMNITFPVCLQKPPSTEGMNGNGSASCSMAFRKKRQAWSAEEDKELIAAVRHFGEDNWTHIIKGGFKGARNAAQLSQRWALIRRRCNISTPFSQPGLQPTEAQKAVNHALSLALGNPPPSKKLAIGAGIQANGASSSQGQQQSKKVVQALPRIETSVSASKSRAAVRKATPTPTSKSDLMVKANSVAAAACMGGLGVLVPKVEPEKTAVPLVLNTEPAKNASAACPSGDSLSLPKAEPGKTVAASSIAKAVGPANTRPLANGNLKLVTDSVSANKPPLLAPRPEGSTMLSTSTSASRIVSDQRVSAASVPTRPKPTVDTDTCKPNGRQKDIAREDGASSLIASQLNKTASTNSEISLISPATQAQAQAPCLLPKKIPVIQTAVHCTPNQNLVDKPSDKTAVPAIGGAGTQSKAKCEGNNKISTAIKVSNACGKPPEVATVARIVSDQRVSAASFPTRPKPTIETDTCKPNGGQKDITREDGASSSVVIQLNKTSSTNLEISRGNQAQAPNLLPKKIPVIQTAVQCAPNQNLADIPSHKTAVPAIGGAGTQSKAKCEGGNKIGTVIKVSNACGKPPEVATVAGTEQGV